MISALRALCAFVLIVLPGVAHAQAWWDEAWTRRQQIVLKGAPTTGNLANFPVMVKITAARFDYSAFKAGGADLRFFSNSNGTGELDFEIETWNPGGTSIVWVEMPTLLEGDANPSSAGNFWMYWGNPDATSAQDVSGTWSAYLYVWHLNDAGSTSPASKVPVAQNGTLTENGGPTSITGQIGSGYRLDGSDDSLSANSIDLADLLGETEVSLEFWVSIKATEGGGANLDTAPALTGVVDATGNAEVAWGWVDSDDPDSFRISGDGNAGQGVTTVFDEAWHHVVMGRCDDDGNCTDSSDKGDVDIWVDGANSVLDEAGGGTDEATTFRDFGKITRGTSDAADYLQADIDEIRIKNLRDTADWVAANYEAQTDDLVNWCSSPSTWYTDGDSDTFGDTASSFTSCAQGVDWVAVGGDCDDEDPLRNPNTVWYTDADNDNYGTGSPGPTQCTDPSAGQANYAPQAGDCNDNNSRTWDTCGTCGDPDTDGHWSGCNQYLSADDGPDLCDGSSSNAIFRNNYGAGCSTCGDDDGDGNYSECDSYVTITRDYCDVDGQPISENNWTQAACTGGCGDDDGDGKYADCDSYVTITRDYCDTNNEPISENNWTQGACTGGCADGDGDGKYSGCDAYLTLTRDYCDTNNQTISENNWTQTACGGGCGDLDTDTRYSGCDAYITITVDLCDTSASDPIGRNNWAAGCTDCEDVDSDDYYVQCDAYITIEQDCDDGDGAVNPETNWFLDGDVDGYGGATPYAGNPVCEDPSNGLAYEHNSLDCNDADAAINPDTLWYFDGDHDGWGNPAPGLAVESCTDPGANYVSNNADCNDNNINITTLTWYADGDGDTYGDPLTEGYGCVAPPGHVANDDDCNDDSNAIKPGATETCGDGVDQNCDGQGGPTGDDDGDGLTWTQETGASISDCDTDSENDGVSDTLEWGNLASSTPRNTDGDGLPDVRDLDDDGDGILTTFESHDDLDGAPACGFAPDGLPSYIDVDSDGDGVCDGAYTPDASECVYWELFDRDPVEPGVQAIPDNHNLDEDVDGVPNAYDFDDFDGGTCDADGDGLASLVENNTCYTPPGESEVCLDPSDSDTNHDGVVDGLEVGPDTGNPLDTDDDGIPDWWDLDDDGDLVPTAEEDYEVPPDGDPTNEDTDGDEIPDYLDVDDDGNGVPTADEDTNGDLDPRNDDQDGDFVADYIDLDEEDGPLGDHDGDSVANAEEVDAGIDPDDPDTDGDGVLDGLEWEDGAGNRLDTDGDTVFDVLDLDDDGDGIPTLIEGSWDADDDGLGNHVDTDADADGSDDRTEGGNAWEADGILPDSDLDGVPDFLDTEPEIFWSDDDLPVDNDPGCACGAVPAPAGALGGLGLLALAALRRRRR